MLVVKVEMWPGGLQEAASEIARIGLDKRTRGWRVADYGVTALLDRDGGEHIVSGEVEGHHYIDGWLPLVDRALREVLLGTGRTPAVDTAIVRLLREEHRV